LGFLRKEEWCNVLSQGPESSPSPWRNIIAALFAGSDGGNKAGLVDKGPGMKGILVVKMGLEIGNGLESSIASIVNGIYVYRTILGTPHLVSLGERKRVLWRIHAEECISRGHQHQLKKCTRWFLSKHVA
jgi:hypothetical protein